MKHKPWPSIESLKSVCKTAIEREKTFITYKSKVKLHGTNAAIRNVNGEIICQSRSRDITPEKDNAGFAVTVLSNIEAFKKIIPDNTVIYGEWCGEGIQKGTAINQIGKKIWAVFSVSTICDGVSHRESDPEAIRTLLGNDLPDWVHILPWHKEPIVINVHNPESSREELETLLGEVEKEDPWVKAVFDKQGIGEGLVMYPLGESFSKYSFKIKGEAHKVKSTKQKVEINPELKSNIEDFVNMFVTPARVEQAVNELSVEYGEVKNIGPIVKWVSQDILKESVDELAETGLEWKQVCKNVSSQARKLYMAN